MPLCNIFRLMPSRVGDWVTARVGISCVPPSRFRLLRENGNGCYSKWCRLLQIQGIARLRQGILKRSQILMYHVQCVYSTNLSFKV